MLKHLKRLELLTYFKAPVQKKINPIRVTKRKEYLEAKRLEALKPKDRTITCKKCGNEFVWTIAEQEFYKEKGFFKPSYCKDCRKRCKVVNNFHKDM